MPQIILEDDKDLEVYREFLEAQRKKAEDRMASIQNQLDQLAQLDKKASAVAVAATPKEHVPKESVPKEPAPVVHLPAHVAVIKEVPATPARPITQDQVIFNNQVIDKVKRVINTVEGPFTAKDLFSLVCADLKYTPEEKLIATKAIQTWLNTDFNKSNSPFLRQRLDDDSFIFAKNVTRLMPVEVNELKYFPKSKKRFTGVKNTIRNILGKSKVPLTHKQVYDIIISLNPFVMWSDRKLLQSTIYSTLLKNVNGQGASEFEVVKNGKENVYVLK